MIKIGEFSKLVQVPVPTLRYYDQIGLLKPVTVDRFTGYRYYSAGQLPRLHRILALKGLGFSLEQIGAVLDEGLTPEHRQAITLVFFEGRQLREAGQIMDGRTEDAVRMMLRRAEQRLGEILKSTLGKDLRP